MVPKPVTPRARKGLLGTDSVLKRKHKTMEKVLDTYEDAE